MALSVQDNVLRCLKKFGDKANSRNASSRVKWKAPYRSDPKARRPEDGKVEGAKEAQ